MEEFTVEYDNVKKTKLYNSNKLEFNIRGNDDYGLDKTLINSIRRSLMLNIDTVGFMKEDINILKNNTPLNNEYIIDRISLLYLNINPIDYDRQYLFKLKIINETEPMLKVRLNDFDIFPMKKNILEEIRKQKNQQYVPDSLKIVDSINNYDLTSPISDKEKEQILNPFILKKDDGSMKKYYPLITELKFSTSDNNQELEINAIPSISNGQNSSNFNNIPCSTYSYVVNDQLAKDIMNNNIQLKKIKKEHVEEYKKKFMTSEYDRYFYRDNNYEPNYYNFIIESQHYNTPEYLWKESIDKLIRDLNDISYNFNLLIVDRDKSQYSIDKINNYYSINLNCDESIVAVIQSHLVNKPFISLCGYKKKHPLTSDIIFKIGIDKMDKDEIKNITTIIQYINRGIDDIINNLTIIKDQFPN